MVKIPEDWPWYHYEVSRIAATIGITFFALAFLLQLYRMMSTKTYYTWSFVAATLFETLGYIFRLSSSNHPRGPGRAMAYFVTSTVFLVLGPSFAAGAVYVTYKRLVLEVGSSFSTLSKQVARIFIFLDISSITMQAAGMSLYGSSSLSGRFSQIKALLIAGFVVQLVSFLAFALISVDYHLRARRNGQRGRWERCLYTLYIIDVLILIRSVYRCVEYATSTLEGGPLRRCEAYFYAFDFVPIFLASVLFGLFHPSRYLKGEDGDEAEVREADQVKMKAIGRHRTVVEIEEDSKV